ncbi:MAG: efflux RND transporter periplasmic adaptor subunit [Beijerinckiaceae bacterium]|nr:efflux RND transporter periplasmic adaptor subunit [Beijerinckiaceae bacterium]MCZ8300778.1 efflux RND transporter periplasmic adaptor subunit [Beijerinckiaceae bacterium]
MRMLVGFVLAGAVGLGGWAVASRQGRPAAEAPPSYRTERVSRGPILASVSAEGVLAAREVTHVPAPFAGQVIELFAETGDPVQAGQVLARFDATPLAARRDEARAALAEAQAARALAEAQVERTRLEMGRARSGSLPDAPPLAGVEADLRLAEAQRAIAAARIDRESIRLRESEAALALAELRAPFDGVILSRAVEAGQIVSPAGPLFVLARSLRLVEIQAGIDQAETGRLRPDQEAEIAVAAHPERVFRGRLKRIGPERQEAGGKVSYRLVIEVPNEDLALLPGMPGSLRIITDRRPEVLRVPNAALRWQPPARADAPAAARARPAVTLSVETDNPAGPFLDPAISAQGVAWFEAMKEDLALSPEQIREVRRHAETMRAEIQSAGNDPAQRRAARQAFTRAIEPVLTPEQRQRYRALQEARRNRTSGERRNPVAVGRVHVLDDRGQPRPVQVLTGLSDGRYTEILGEDLAPGEVLVLESQPAAPRS